MDDALLELAEDVGNCVLTGPPALLEEVALLVEQPYRTNIELLLPKLFCSNNLLMGRT